jgi:hypothetical protein
MPCVPASSPTPKLAIEVAVVDGKPQERVALCPKDPRRKGA